MNKPLRGHFEKAGVTPRRHLVEIRTTTAAEYTLGQELAADVFEAGQSVDVTGTTKGKGYAGVMKRHGFKGMGASHGAHRNHRKPGSIGGCATPGRVFKGMRMAGRMGDVRQTTQSLTVHAVDVEQRPASSSRAPSPAPRAASCSSAPPRRASDRHDRAPLTTDRRRTTARVDLDDADRQEAPAPSSCPPRSSTSRSTSR